MPIRAVVFDYGGVLAHCPKMPEIGADIRRQIGASAEDFNAKFALLFSKCSEHPQLMVGKITVDEFEEGLFLDAVNEVFETELKEPIRWLRRYVASLEHSTEAIDFVKKLREHNICTALLTNNFHVDKDTGSVNIDRSLFDVEVESRLEGVQKPDRKIYEICHSRLLSFDESLKKEEILFLDDTLKNIQAAVEFGWQGVHVVNPWSPQTAILEAEELIFSQKQ